jgi:TolA-binding protein
MKTTERHQLKSNEVAETIAAMREAVSGRGRLVAGALVAVLVLALGAAAFIGWRGRQQQEAAAALAGAMATASAPVIPVAPGSPPPQPGTFTTEAARAEAASQALLDVANRHAGTEAGLAARYQAAGFLAGLGRTADAEREFAAVVAGAGRGSIYGRMARLGVAEMQMRSGRYDAAIAAFREVATSGEGDLPVDGILMQLARAYALAGKTAEAAQTYQRVIDEFPDSLYGADARREVEGLAAASRPS